MRVNTYNDYCADVSGECLAALAGAAARSLCKAPGLGTKYYDVLKMVLVHS